MTTCSSCHDDPTVNACCGSSHLHMGGRRVARVPHGPSDALCTVCGVPPGMVHMLGCADERCPSCPGRLWDCTCLDGDGPADGLWGDDGEPGVETRPAGDGLRLRALDGDDRGDGHDAPPRPAPGVVLTPLPATAAPYRARHHTDVQAVARWSLAHGRGCDRDVVALVIDLFDEHRVDDALVLTRPDVDHLIGAGFRNMLSMSRTLIPDGYVEDVWTVLMWLHDEGRIAAASDPLPQLLEPLQCYGGLDADGRPRPDGVDVDFPCQCHLPHDASLPPGVGARIIGYDVEARRPLVVHARLALRSAAPPWSAFAPLLALFRRVEDEAWLPPVEVDRFRHSGSIDATRWAPRLTMYHLDARGGELFVDDDGGCWRPRPDRRRKLGYRWERCDHRAGLAAAGADPYRRREPADELDETDDDRWPELSMVAPPRPQP